MRKLRVATMVVVAVISSAPASAQEDVQQHPSCKFCGMDRAKFAQTRMVISYQDGSSTGVCSIHCAAVELASNLDRAPAAIQVGDAVSRKLVDAEKATWVVGGAKPGVMTVRGKWAFESREAAEAFRKENGGVLATFEEALKTAYEDMYTDLAMIRAKRKAMRSGSAEGHPGHMH